MPIRRKQGNIFDAPHEEGAQTIVNTINTKGVMGKGLALEFKRRFPEMYEDYKRRCQEGAVQVGEPYLYKESHPWILNFPTKDHWRYPSRLEWIRQGLDHFVRRYREWGIESIAFPQLGTLSGRLAWEQVRQVMEDILDPIEIDVWIYTYRPPEDQEPEKSAKRRRRGRRGRTQRSADQPQLL